MSFFVNEYVVFNQDTTVDQAPATAYSVDYKLTLHSVDLNTVFPLTFQQNSIDVNAVDVTLNRSPASNAAMVALVAAAKNTWALASNAAGVVSSGITAGVTLPLATRLLEVVALRVFGHAAARAAFRNDTAFQTSVDEQLPNKIYNALNNKRNDLFGAYVNDDRIKNEDDMNNSINMNLANFNMQFIVSITGSIKSDEDNSVITTGGLHNGYEAHGGVSTMTGGVYNIPVLVELKTSASS